MACSLKASVCVSGSNEAINKCRVKGSFPLGPSIRALQFGDSGSKEFFGKSLDVSDPKGLTLLNAKTPSQFSINAQASLCVSKAMRWWEKTLKPNMVEIHSAQELVDSLLNAGDRLVIVDFYSPGCGGCRSLHPKICQLAETNPNSIFLKVNYEELKPICHTLHIHVLPFFRFYRGPEGKVCSFSCTNATIKKFKDALAKYGTERYSLGPAKGLDESELLALSSAGLLSRDSALKIKKDEKMEDFVFEGMKMSTTFDKDEKKLMGMKEGNAFVMA